MNIRRGRKLKKRSSITKTIKSKRTYRRTPGLERLIIPGALILLSVPILNELTRPRKSKAFYRVVNKGTIKPASNPPPFEYYKFMNNGDGTYNNCYIHTALQCMFYVKNITDYLENYNGDDIIVSTLGNLLKKENKIIEDAMFIELKGITGNKDINNMDDTGQFLYNLIEKTTDQGFKNIFEKKVKILPDTRNFNNVPGVPNKNYDGEKFVENKIIYNLKSIAYYGSQHYISGLYKDGKVYLINGSTLDKDTIKPEEDPEGFKKILSIYESSD